MKRLSGGIMLRGAALCALAALAACQKSEGDKTAETEPVRPVLYTIVEPRPIAQAGFAGTIEARYSTDLAFRVLGRIISRPVQVGDLVTRDEVVAALDPTALDLAVQSARADLASAEAQFANASASEERQRILLKGNNVSQADYDAARQARDSAQAALQKAQAGLKKAQDQRGYAVLRPDFDGVVSATDAEVGQVVAAGQAVMTVARPDIREAVLDIPDRMTNYLAPGTPFDILLQADPTVTGKGTVREVAPQADAQTRTRRVRVALDNPPQAFRLGATISAVPAGPRRDEVTLPVQALLEEDGRSDVWIIDPGKQTVALHPVQVIERHGESFVAGGVAAGSYVAIAGVHELKEGQKVRLDRKGAGL
ncbi:MAG: efflux RND transporter periplasmic adaptor subunit [Rhizobiales bacterium]|nr:efflux RND transporter periplasmic adaptor subunit [Hyphomicrobiales bacterium]OJX98762.1 MAG: efflux transporter periplasmic adaptor subunit [Rhizobiales bacterium 63-22]